jgi:hypothetical protein
VVVMAVIGATFYLVLPRLTAAVVQDPLRDTVRYFSVQSQNLRSSCVATKTPRAIYVDMESNRLFTGAINPPQANPSRALDAFALGSDLRLAGVLFPQKSRQTSGTALICFHRQGHADQAIVHVAAADGRRFSLYLDPFLPGIKVYPDFIDYQDLLGAYDHKG